MDEIVPVVALLMVFGMPVAITWLVMHYRERSRREHLAPTAATSASSVQLLSMAEKMEHRIDALEQILDAEAPGWRKKYHEHA